MRKCNKCGKEYPPHLFTYKTKNLCKFCHSEYNLKYYHEHKVCKYDIVYTTNDKGFPIKIKGKRKYIVWDDKVVDELKTMYPDSTVSVIADKFGISRTAVYRKVKELGLKKSKRFYLIMRHKRSGKYACKNEL